METVVDRARIEKVLEQIHPSVFYTEQGTVLVNRIEHLLATMGAEVEPRDLDLLARSVLNCHKCTLRDGCERPTIGVGLAQSDLMVAFDVADANMDTALIEQEAPGLTIYKTAVVKCGISPGDLMRRGIKIGKQCIENWFDQEVELVRPKVMLLLGDLGSELLFGGRGVARDRELNPYTFTTQNSSIPTYISYHPFYANDTLASDGRIMAALIQDIKMVVKEVKRSVLWNSPSPTYSSEVPLEK